MTFQVQVLLWQTALLIFRPSSFHSMVCMFNSRHHLSLLAVSPFNSTVSILLNILDNLLDSVALLFYSSMYCHLALHNCMLPICTGVL